MDRSSGVLMPMSSLPSPYGIGTMGKSAYLDSFFFRRAFRKISPEQLRPKSQMADGAIFTDEEHRTEDLMVSESRFSAPEWNRREDLFPEEKPDKRRGRRRR